MSLEDFHIQPKLLKGYAAMRRNRAEEALQRDLYQIVGRYIDLTLVSDGRTDYLVSF